MCTDPWIWPSHKQRVHGPADVVDRQHPVDLAGLPVDDDELGGVGEHRVDDRVLEALLERVRPVDAVLALVVDARPAPVGEGPPAGVGDGARRPSAFPGTRSSGRRRARGSCRRGRAPGAGSTPSSSTATWSGDGVDALAHLGPAVANLDVAVLGETDHRLHDLHQAVAEPGILEPEAQPDRLAVEDGLLVGRP